MNSSFISETILYFDPKKFLKRKTEKNHFEVLFYQIIKRCIDARLDSRVRENDVVGIMAVNSEHSTSCFSLLKQKHAPLMSGLILFLLVLPNIFCAANLSANFSAAKNNQPLSISTRDYGVFLNSTAASDPNHLYDWKMADGSWKILRSGAPGNYHYEVVANAAFSNGDDFENTPMFFLSDADAEQYSIFSKTNFSASCSPDVIDEELHVSDVSFAIAAAEQSSSALAIVGNALGFERILGLFSILAGEAVGEFSDEEGSVNSNEYESEHENNALENHDRSLMNDLLTDSPESRLDGHFQATTMNTITSHEGLPEMPATSGGDSHFSQEVEEHEDVLFDGKKMAVPSLSKKIYFSNDVSGKTGGRKAAAVPFDPKKINVPNEPRAWKPLQVLPRRIPFHNEEIVAGFSDLPEVLVKHEIPGFYASGFKNYKQEYQKKYNELLEDFKITDPATHALLLTWQSAYETWIGAAGIQNQVNADAKLHDIEDNLPLKAHAATAFYRAGGVMEIFEEFQNESFEALKNQKQNDPSILLATIARNDELINKASAQIKRFFEIIETCQAKSAEPSVQAHPGIVEEYEHIVRDASSSIDLYVGFAKKTGMKDALNMSCFLQGQGANLKELEYWFQKNEEIIANGNSERAGNLLNASSGWAHRAIENFYMAIRATSPQEKNALAKRGGYGLLGAEELAVHGWSERMRDLYAANTRALDAVNAFKKNDLEKGKYLLKRAEIYAEQGSAAGGAFTFEKYQQEKLKEQK